MIEIELKNKNVLTISDFHIEKVSNRVAYSPKMADELYNIFSYPECHWGSDRPAIVKRDFTLIVSGIIPEYFISVWLNGQPKNEKKYGSHLIVSFFADWDGKSIVELVKDNISDLDEVFQDYSIDFDL